MTCDGELCILFGSRAKGCAKKGSDVDIAIIGDGAKVMHDPFYHIL
ncbi:MAG TPA: nucleotidyltransferase domain-containing protein [Spirochaetota bacterium]|nr:nucleotidyltransferase domain-containing protein [Spirochaetota bacterium]HRV16371.1 nucleotidyltransferase domain-containing protein [Spirochaetota bacterium]